MGLRMILTKRKKEYILVFVKRSNSSVLLNYYKKNTGNLQGGV